MKKLVFLLVCLILFIIGIILFNHFNYSQDKIKKLQPVLPLYEQISDLDLDGKNEIIDFYSPPIDLTGGNTDIFINTTFAVVIARSVATWQSLFKIDSHANFVRSE